MYWFCIWLYFSSFRIFWKFAFLGIGYFCMTVNILELCSGMQLKYLEVVWLFYTSLLRFVNGPSLEVIIFHHWGRTPLITLPEAPWIMWLFYLPARTRHSGVPSVDLGSSCPVRLSHCQHSVLPTLATWSTGLSVPSLQLRESTELCLGSSVCTAAWKLSWGSQLSHWITLFYFPVSDGLLSFVTRETLYWKQLF